MKPPYEVNEVDLDRVGMLIGRAKAIAQEYRKLTGRPLGITGEVAEYEAARLLNLKLSKVRQAGYDALRSDGSKVQIKGRVRFETTTASQRLGRIKLDSEWDSLILVILDEDFMPLEIYEAPRSQVEAALSLPGSLARNKRGMLGVRKFQSIAELIWSRDV
jgi:hypothetical protein